MAACCDSRLKGTIAGLKPRSRSLEQRPRRCALQPRVGRHGLPWGKSPTSSNRNAVPPGPACSAATRLPTPTALRPPAQGWPARPTLGEIPPQHHRTATRSRPARPARQSPASQRPRRCALQPRVGRQGLPWGKPAPTSSNRNAVPPGPACSAVIRIPTPTALRPPAQGWPARPTLGTPTPPSSNRNAVPPSPACSAATRIPTPTAFAPSSPGGNRFIFDPPIVRNHTFATGMSIAGSPPSHIPVPIHPLRRS